MELRVLNLMLLLVFASSSLAFADEESETPKPPETSSVSLADAQRYAIEHNLEVLALRRQYEEAVARTGRARSKFYPTLGVAGGMDSEMNDDTQTSSRTETEGTQTATLGYGYVKYNLFNGFEDIYRSEMADTEAQKAEIKLKRTEFRVGRDVEKVFHLYIFKKDAIELKKEALKLNETHRKMAVQRRQSGMAADSDIMEFDLRDALLKSDVLLLQQELEETRANLRRLLGQEIGAAIEPKGELQHQHIVGNLVEYMKRIKDECEPVIVAAKDLAVATTESKIWKSRWLPRLNLDAKAGYLPLIDRPKDGGANATIMLVATFDIFNGFDSSYEKRELESRRTRAEADLKNALISEMTKMEVAFRKIKTIQARVDLEEKNADRAERYYKSTVSEYRRGVKNSADVKGAAEVLFDAQLRRENYKYEFLSERIALEQSLGGPVKTESIKE